MRIAMQPVITLLHSLFLLSSDGFVKEQMLSSARGEGRKFRVLELFFDGLLSAFEEHISAVFHKPMLALPFHSMTKPIRSLASRMLTRAYASLHQTLLCQRSSSLVMLFGVLAGDVQAFADLKACMLDGMSTAVRSMFPDADALGSDEARAVLRAIAAEYDVDTLQVERGFSQIRRRVLAKSNQTWRPTQADIAAECLFRHCVLEKRRQQYFRGQRSTVAAKSGDSENKPRQRKQPKQVQGGGPWRAFMRIKSAGKKFTGVGNTRLADEYHEIKENNSEAFAVLKSLGDLAHARAVRDAQEAKQQPDHQPILRRKNFDFDPSTFAAAAGIEVNADVQAANNAAPALAPDVASADVREALCLQDTVSRLLSESRAAGSAKKATEKSEGSIISAQSDRAAVQDPFQVITQASVPDDAEASVFENENGSSLLCVPGLPNAAHFTAPAASVAKVPWTRQ